MASRVKFIKSELNDELNEPILATFPQNIP